MNSLNVHQLFIHEMFSNGHSYNFSSSLNFSVFISHTAFYKTLWTSHLNIYTFLSSVHISS